MSNLSVVLIVKNEAHNIYACLQSVSFADEIIVMDAGSTDETREKAARYTDKVFTNTQWRGYGPQRQLAQQHAQSDWILMLDADERVTPELAAEIRQAVAENDQTCVYEIPRLTWCFGRFIRHGGWYPDRVARLYPNTRAGYGDALVHERLIIPPDMTVKRLHGNLLHFSYRSMHHYLVKSADYAQAWATTRHAAGKRSGLCPGMLHGVSCFLRMYVFKAGFLDGRAGLLLALLSAHSTFVKYADLWNRDREFVEGKDAR